MSPFVATYLSITEPPKWRTLSACRVGTPADAAQDSSETCGSNMATLKWGGHPCLPCVRLQIEAQRRSFKSKPLHRPASQFPSTQQTDTANHQRPVTEPKRNISSVFNKCSRPRLDIRNSAAILRAVNRAHHKRPCRNPCSNECKGKQDLARTPKFKKPDRICQMLQSNFLYH